MLIFCRMGTGVLNDIVDVKLLSDKKNILFQSFELQSMAHVSVFECYFCS